MPGCTSTDPSSSGAHSGAFSEPAPSRFPPPPQPRHFRPQVRTRCPPGGPSPGPRLCSVPLIPRQLLPAFVSLGSGSGGEAPACLGGAGQVGGQLLASCPLQPCRLCSNPGSLGSQTALLQNQRREKVPSKRVKGGRLNPLAGQQRPPDQSAPLSSGRRARGGWGGGASGGAWWGLCMFSVGAGGTGIHRVWEAASTSREDIQHERGPGG